MRIGNQCRPKIRFERFIFPHADGKEVFFDIIRSPPWNEATVTLAVRDEIDPYRGDTFFSFRSAEAGDGITQALYNTLRR